MSSTPGSSPAAPLRQPRTLPSWIDFWGLGALALASLAVLAAVVLALRPATLALAVLGLVVLAVGIARKPRRGGWAWLTVACGGALCSLVLIAVAAAPGLLNSVWTMDAQPTEPDPNVLLVVSRVDPREQGRPLQENEVVDAATHYLQQDDLALRIESARIGHLPERGSSPLLLINLYLVQSHPGRTITHDRYVPGKLVPVLTDDAGRSYAFLGERVRKPPTKFDVLLKSDHYLIFEPPPADVQSLKLELPAAAWGRTGACRFHLTRISREEPPTSPAKLIARTKAMLRKPAGTPPDPVLGRTLFIKNCQECHTLHGFGGKVGPDLLASKKRDDLDFVLTSILDPSAVIEKEYLPTLVVTTSGVVHNGIIKQQDDRAITLMIPNKTMIIPRDEIESLRESKVSLMPADLVKDFDEHQLRSLLAYVQSTKQYPLVATVETAPYFFFYEKNLSNWQPGEPGWRASEGEIIAPAPSGGKAASLVSLTWIPSDFQSLIWFQPGKDGQGAIVLADANDPRSPMAMRIEFSAGKPLAFRGFTSSPESPGPVVKEGWNKLEIIAAERRIQVRLDNQEVLNAADDHAPGRRVIVLEGARTGSSETRFRNLELRLLAPNAPPNPARE